MPEKNSSEISPQFNVSTGVSKSELLEILNYEIAVYKNEIGIDETDDYDQGFINALAWVIALVDPEV